MNRKYCCACFTRLCVHCFILNVFVCAFFFVSFTSGFISEIDLISPLSTLTVCNTAPFESQCTVQFVCRFSAFCILRYSGPGITISRTEMLWAKWNQCSKKQIIRPRNYHAIINKASLRSSFISRLCSNNNNNNSSNRRQHKKIAHFLLPSRWSACEWKSVSILSRRKPNLKMHIIYFSNRTDEQNDQKEKKKRVEEGTTDRKKNTTHAVQVKGALVRCGVHV